MIEKFSVGEIAITMNATHFIEHDGYPCLIIGPLEYTRCLDLNTMKYVWTHVYKIKVLDINEHLVSVRPWQLRKLGYPVQKKYRELAETIIGDNIMTKKKVTGFVIEGTGWGTPKQNEITLLPQQADRNKHCALTPDQLGRIARLCEVTKEACPSTLDEWIGDFIGEARPENEIRTVEAIAVVYLRLTDNTDLNSEDKKSLYGTLCFLSTGFRSPEIEDKIPKGLPTSSELFEMFRVARAAGDRPYQLNKNATEGQENSLDQKTQEKKGETVTQQLSKMDSHRFKRGTKLKGIIL